MDAHLVKIASASDRVPPLECGISALGESFRFATLPFASLGVGFRLLILGQRSGSLDLDLADFAVDWTLGHFATFDADNSVRQRLVVTALIRSDADAAAAAAAAATVTCGDDDAADAHRPMQTRIAVILVGGRCVVIGTR